MRKVIIGLVVLALLLVAGFIFIPGLVPSSVYKEQIETQLSKELGRPVKIAGDVSLQSFPFVRATTNGVTIDNLTGFSEMPFLSVETLEARIKLFPLLSKRVEISGFDLIKPQVSLERRADGKANWDISRSDDQTRTETDEAPKPFLRDGRFQSLDPQIEAFKLVDGQVSYRDNVKGQSYTLEDIDGSLSLPGLNKTLDLDLALTFENKRADIVLSFDSLRSFLDGQEAPIKASLKSEFATIGIDGKFLASEQFDFTANIDSKISDAKSVQEIIPSDIPYLNLITELTSEGEVSFKNKILQIKETSLNIVGDGKSASYVGDATISEDIILDGRADFDITNFSDLAPYLPENIPSLDILTSLKGSANLTGTPDGFTAQDIISNVEGEGLSGQFKGTAKSSAKGASANGTFTSELANISQIAKYVQVETPYAALLGSLTTTGNIIFEGKTISFSNLDARGENGAVNGTYKGDFSFNENLKANGQFALSIADIAAVTTVLPNPIPYSSAIKTISAKGDLKTENGVFILSSLDANLSEGLINGRFLGSGQYNLNDKNALALGGKLDSQITDIRALAALNGTALPPDTEAGSIYDSFALKGDLTGTPKSLSFKNTTLTFDNITGTGDMIVATAPDQKPFLDASLTLAQLDLRPYMASYSAQRPEGEIQPWSETPINVTPFQALNGDFNISATEVITDRLTLGQTDIKATLRIGVFNANLPNLALYGGGGNMDITYNTAKPTPELTLTMGLNQLSGNKFLSAIAGFTQASGQAKTELSITSSGKSQAAIMRGLNGQGGFNLSEGQIQGIDATEFLTGLDQAFTSRSLPSGIGVGKITKFNDIQSLFKIENGIVSINKFNLAAAGFAASGQGNVDLGNQTIDFNFRPRTTGENANSLASFGIPLKFSGKFGEASAGLDTDFLATIVAERARAEAASRIQDQVKGPIGDILGGVLGGGNQAPTTPESTDTPTKTPQTPEDAVTDALGGLFGIKKETSPQTTPPKEEDKVDEQASPDNETKKEAEEKDEKSDIEKALGSLFGE